MKNADWKKLILFVSNILPAIFLTILVDEITLTTMLQRICISIYFFIMLNILVCFFIKRRKRVWKLLIFSSILSLFFVKMMGFDSFYKIADIEIVPIGKENIEANGEEVWIKDIIVDGKSYNNENYNNSAGWFVDSSSGYLVSCNEEMTQPVRIRMKYKNEVQLVFVAHPWSGGVNVDFNKRIDTYDLYSSNGMDIEKTFTRADGKNIICLQNICVMLGSWILFTEIIYFLLVWSLFEKINGRKSNLYFIFCLICVLCFDCAELDKISIFLFLAWSYFQARYLNNNEFYLFVKSHNKKILIMSSLLSYCFSFCAVGNNLFLYVPFWQISLEKIVIFFAWAIYFFIQIQFIMYCFYKINNRNKEKLVTISKVRNIICVVIAALCIAIFPVLLVDDFIIKGKQHESTVEILPLQEVGENSVSNEVQILEIIIDGKKMNLSNIDVPLGWIEKSGNLIYSEGDKVEPLILQFPSAKNIYIKFVRHNWSGKVKITDGSFETIWDLSDKEKTYFYKVQSNFDYVTKSVSDIFYLGFYFLCVIIFTRILYLHINKNRLRRFICNFSFCEIVFLFYLFMCYPGNCNADIISQYGQAIGVYTLSDAHPMLSTLWIRCLLWVHDSLGFIAYVQATAFAICFAFILSLYKKGSGYVRLAIIMHLGIGLFSIHLTKDLWYSVGILLLSISLVLITKNGIRKNMAGCFSLFIGTALLQVFRHNGIITLILCIAIFSIWFLKSKKIIPLLAILVLSIIGSKVMLSTIKDNYFTESMDKTKMGGNLNALLFYDLYGAHIYTKNLNEDTEIMLNDMLAFEKGEPQYYIYSLDNFGWSNLRNEFKEGIKKYSSDRILKTYMGEFLKNPEILLAIRLKSNNIMWNLFEAKDSFNERIPIGVYKGSVDEFGGKNLSFLRIEIVKSIISSIQNVKILDAIFWRYTLMLLVILSYVLYCIKFMKREVVFIFPALFEWIFYMGILQVQIYRYGFSIICCSICLPYILANMEGVKISKGK